MEDLDKSGGEFKVVDIEKNLSSQGVNPTASRHISLSDIEVKMSDGNFDAP